MLRLGILPDATLGDSDMAASNQPVGSGPTRPASEHAVREWLNSLADGECSEAEFLHAMRRRFAADREGTWEVLSLLDQYYRRGKIKPDVFQSLKTSLAGAAMGAREDPAGGVRPGTSTVVTIPATAMPDGAREPVIKPRADVREISIGDLLRNRYRITAVLGHGGMGTVFEAIDEERLDLVTCGRRIAVKVLHTAVTHRAELLGELRREFQNLQLLSHPNIVRVYEFDRDGQTAFFTMELMQGALLSEVLAARESLPLPRSQALAVIRDVGAALAHAHARGVVHGDVNPQNIFLTQERDVRVMDFGASYRMVGGPLTTDSELGFVPFATPGYASCQLQDGEQPDARDDVFAFACVAYLLLTGKHPFEGHSATEARELGLRPRPPADLTGPQWRALKAGLRWKRETRTSTVADWLERFDLSAAAKRLDPLDSLTSPPRFSKRKYLLAAAMLVVLVLLGGVGYWAIDKERAVAVVAQTQTPPPPGAPIVAVKPPVGNAQSAASMASPAPSPPPIPSATQTRPAASDASASASGMVRLELATDAVEVPSGDKVAHVSLRRRGNVRKEASFAWWTESGTAKPGADYATVGRHVEQLAPGQTNLTLNVTLASTLRSQSKSFYVVIDQADDGSLLGAKTLTMVTLLPSN